MARRLARHMAPLWLIVSDIKSVYTVLKVAYVGTHVDT